MKKIKVWHSNTLANILTISTQIQAGVDALAINTEAQSLNDLPPSLVPTHALYELCLCYEMLYNKALEHDLLSTGNIKSTSTLN